MELLPPSTNREPRMLIMPEENSCLSCVTTNILFSHGMVDAQWPVSATDELLGREPGQPLRTSAADFLLMNYGFKLQFFDAFDANRFLTEGRAYLREVYGEAWPEPDFSNYWTDEKLLERQLARQTEEAQYKAFGEKFEHFVKEPAIEDIDNLLLDGNQVISQVRVTDGSTLHSCLIYPDTEQDGEFAIYNPDPDDGGLVWIDREYFLGEWWLPSHGITGLKPITSN